MEPLDRLFPGSARDFGRQKAAKIYINQGRADAGLLSVPEWGQVRLRIAVLHYLSC